MYNIARLLLDQKQPHPYMYEVFDWSRDVTPWHYLSRPWVEGDGTASKMVNVRCVRTLE